jgi:CheY-like chemotaxis protein
LHEICSDLALMPERTPRVLVVDDDFEFRETLTYVLRDSGYEVVSASDGEEALARLRSGPRPCVIILDLRMPGMNGWQFREAQMRDAALSAIPVLVLSGDGQAAEEARAFGVEVSLKKPVPLDALLRSIQRYC